MSQWQEQIRQHPVWQQLEVIGPAIDQASAREGLEAPTLDLLERIRTVVAFTGRRLAAIDPALVSLAVLQGIASPLQAATSELQNFVSDGQPSRVDSANNKASELLVQLASLVAPLAPEDLTSLSEAAASYRESMKGAVESAQERSAEVESQAEQLAKRLAELTSEVAAERARLTQLTSDFQAQFSTAQDNRSAEFSAFHGSRLQEFSSAQSDRQKRFDDLLASYSQRLNDQDGEFTGALRALQEESSEKLSAVNGEFRERAAAILEEIELHKQDVERLVGIVGDRAVTGGYRRAADAAKHATWLWQLLTLAGFGSVIWFAFTAFLPAIEGDFSWERFAGRVILTLTVSVFAAYASAQADRYMEAERRNRKLALELEALGPYLVSLPEEEQQKFRVSLGERIFGRDDPGLNRRERSPTTTLDVVGKNRGLSQFVADIVRATRGG